MGRQKVTRRFQANRGPAAGNEAAGATAKPLLLWRVEQKEV
jgi:hypothetical protein